MASVEEYQVNGKTHYRVRWYENGRKKSRTAGPNKTTLKSLIKKIEHREVLEIPSPLSTAHCVKEYLAVKAKEAQPSTVDIARRALNHLDPKKSAHEVTPQDIERIKNRLIEFKTPSGVNIVLRNASTFFEFCLRMGYVNKNPVKTVKKFKPKSVARFLTRQEITNLYKSSDMPLRKSIFILYNTGMRKGEYLSIKRTDIGPTSVQVTGKQGVRQIPLKPGVRKVLLGICGYWSKDGFKSAFRRAVNRARMGRIRVHDLRHTFASAYLKSGGTLADLRIIGGWKSLTALQIYAHFQENYLAERMVKVRL